MSTSTETTTAAVNTASKKAAQAAAAVAETLPTVVETEALTATLEVPTKVVLNNNLIVLASAVGGSALTVAGFYGWKKFQEFRAKKAAEKTVVEISKATETGK